MRAAKLLHKQCVRKDGPEATPTDHRKWRERPRRESGHCCKTPQTAGLEVRDMRDKARSEVRSLGFEFLNTSNFGPRPLASRSPRQSRAFYVAPSALSC